MCCPDCGEDPEKQTRHESSDSSESNNSPIDADIQKHSRDIVRGKGVYEKLSCGRHEHNPDDCSGQTECRGLNQELPKQTRSRCSKRNTDRNLFCSSSSASKKQRR